jgi:NADH-quinone oxidoreductase subunit M
MGMPGFSGFIAEFPIFMGLWQVQPILAIIAAISIVITASYIMRVITKIFFGKLPEEFEGHISPINNQDRIALVLLAGILVLVGVYPSIMAPMVESGARNILALLGGA